MQQTLPY